VEKENVTQLVRKSGATEVHARGTHPGVIAAISQALLGNDQ